MASARGELILTGGVVTFAFGLGKATGRGVVGLEVAGGHQGQGVSGAEEPEGAAVAQLPSGQGSSLGVIALTQSFFSVPHLPLQSALLLASPPLQYFKQSLQPGSHACLAPAAEGKRSWA